MMLGRQEIVKLVLYKSGIKKEEYDKLKEKVDEKGVFPEYEKLEEDIKNYKPTKGLIYLDEFSSKEQKNWEDLLKQIKESAYDLRLDKQYLLGEKIYELDSDKNPILRIPPHDVAVVLTYECLRIPEQVVGTFQLNLRFVLKGLMLANGAQVDPGYEGKLACVLFNLTNKPILLKYKEVFAKISLIQLTHPNKYKGGHQGYTKIQQFIGDWMPTSGLAEINENLENYRKDLEKHKKDIEDKIRNAIIIILGILSAILAIYNIILRLYPPQT